MPSDQSLYRAFLTNVPNRGSLCTHMDKATGLIVMSVLLATAGALTCHNCEEETSGGVPKQKCDESATKRCKPETTECVTIRGSYTTDKTTGKTEIVTKHCRDMSSWTSEKYCSEFKMDKGVEGVQGYNFDWKCEATFCNSEKCNTGLFACLGSLCTNMNETTDLIVMSCDCLSPTLRIG